MNNVPGCIKPDTETQVFFYEQDFYVLSNFSAFNLQWAGLTFPTTEHAYHWLKFNWPGDDAHEIRTSIRLAPSAHEAFKIAERRKAHRRADWDKVKVDQLAPAGVRGAFWRRWQHWKAQGAVLVADCCWPVEARFLAAAVDDCRPHRDWAGPYPLHDLASVLLALGRDPLATNERLPSELPVHHPLMDARQSARQLLLALGVEGTKNDR